MNYWRGDIISCGVLAMNSSVVNPKNATGELDANEIKRELEKVIASPVFRGSKRCQSFLQYVVGKTLEGDTRTLKERTLAIEVFGRDEAEDLTDDSIVRVGAREVRKRLAQYYVAEGAQDFVRIELPPGSYIPLFLHQRIGAPDSVPHTDLTSPPATLVVPQPVFSRGRKLAFWAVGTLILLAVAGTLLWRSIPVAITPFDTFWKPAFLSKTAPVILLAHPIVYQPSTRASRLDEERNGVPMASAQRAIQLPPKMLDGSDYVAAMDQFVGFGDAEAALRVSGLFNQHHINAPVRLASRVDFYDLRQASAVLIGAFTNRWTVEFTKSMRYRFSYHNGKPCIEDAEKGCAWTLTTKTDNGESTEDYILVSRLPHPATNGFIVICAGLNVYGTEEGGRILTDPESLNQIIKKLPPHWAEHNLELVIHVSVIGDAPAQSNVVAVHTW